MSCVPALVAHLAVSPSAQKDGSGLSLPGSWVQSLLRLPVFVSARKRAPQVDAGLTCRALVPTWPLGTSGVPDSPFLGVGPTLYLSLSLPSVGLLLAIHLCLFTMLGMLLFTVGEKVR